MKARGVVLQGLLAGAGLVAAWFVWQRGPESMPGEVEVLDAPKGALVQVRYEDEARWVEISRAEDNPLWVALGTKPAPGASADAGTPDGGLAGGTGDGGVQAVAATPPPPRVLRANEAAEKLFERFAPLRASRALGVLDEKKLEEVGLKNS